MASILARSLVSFSRSSVLPRVSTSVKHYSEKVSPYYEPTEGKLASKDASMPDEMGGTVGIERYELLEKARGNLDPFGTEGVFLAKRGTKEEPTLVPTVCEDRIVGCVCEEDSTTIRWTKMFLGETKRCQCGYFFKLVANS